MYRKRAQRKRLCGVVPTWLPNWKKYPKDSRIVPFCVASVHLLRFRSFLRSSPKTPSNPQLLVNFPAYSLLIRTSTREGAIMSEYSEWKKKPTKMLLLMLLWKWDTKLQKQTSACYRVPRRNLKRMKGVLILWSFLRRQAKSGLMANKISLKEYEEKIYINDDITLLRARLAKALKLRVDIKPVTMLMRK